MAIRSTQEIAKPLQNRNLVLSMINDAFWINKLDDVEFDTYEGPYEFVDNMPNEENEEIGDLVRDCNQKFYERCQKYSKLSFLLRLYHIKCLYGMTDKAITMILELLKYAFEYAKIPNFFFFEAKKICKHCKKSRGKPKGTNGKKKLLVNFLCYFPLKPRLQRLFMCPKIATPIRWHVLNSNLDGLLRHPRDAKA
ncbi:hypothetical protein CR513_28707, partial [Mucuna pruriens]